MNLGDDVDPADRIRGSELTRSLGVFAEASEAGRPGAALRENRSLPPLPPWAIGGMDH